MDEKIVIVDLGIGNLANVKKALDAEISNDPYKIEKGDKIVLPGVGNFESVIPAVAPLRKELIDGIEEGKPFLGICLGIQLLFEESEEGGGEGLGLLSGRVAEFREARKPHIGWNQVFITEDSPLFSGIKDGSYFYFVHSYYMEPSDEGIISGYTDYENGSKRLEFASAVSRDNIYGVQFHPEKSSENGLRLMKNFKNM